MHELILHHYELSPFSEKIRRILAFKDVPWRAVEQPVIAPKPELTPLTGGYRRIPVLQIGADVYCDTALIARRIEALHPQPATLPAAQAGAIALIEDWADHRLFMHCVPPVVVDLIDALPQGFLEDRAQMSPGFTREALTAGAPHALGQALQALDRLNSQLQCSSYLLGEAFTLADAACYHPVRFMQNSPTLALHVEARPGLAAWCARIAGFGAGRVTPLTAAAALEIARTAAPEDIAGAALPDAPHARGQMVEIVADDYGREKTTGRVERIRQDEVVVVRTDPALGEIAVHYPRAGYRISAA
ncbi:MAG: glutathione S-transferase family protein [Gammaproteobacteria bacterium]